MIICSILRKKSVKIMIIIITDLDVLTIERCKNVKVLKTENIGLVIFLEIVGELKNKKNDLKPKEK